MAQRSRRKPLRVMQQGTPTIRPMLMALAALALLASPLPVMAQSCALCYTQAASAGTRMIDALKSGILILIVPPTLMSIAMVFIMYRNRRRCRDAAGTADSEGNWHKPDLSIAATPWPPLTR